MKNVTRALFALLVFSLVAVAPMVADVKDSNGDLAKNQTIGGKVTSVTTDGQSVTSVTIKKGNGDTYTVDASGGDNAFLDDLEKAFDNDNKISIDTDNSGNIESLTRSKSKSTSVVPGVVIGPAQLVPGGR